jgi:hypothetical protein
VIPPKEWEEECMTKVHNDWHQTMVVALLYCRTQQLPPIDKQLEYVRVRNPIVSPQAVGLWKVSSSFFAWWYHLDSTYHGKSRHLSTNQCRKRRSYTLRQWYVLCQEIDHKPSDPKADRYTRLNPPTTRKRPRRSSGSPQDNKTLIHSLPLPT